MKETLQALGLTEQDVLNKLVDRLIEQYSPTHDDINSEFESRLQKAVRDRIDKSIGDVIESHVKPRIAEMTSAIVLQTTNEWGEKSGKALTFTEFLVQRVDAFIREKVNYEGKARTEANGYSWNESTTRIAHMIHEHLKYNISRAMEQALGNVNSSVRKGLEEAVTVALNNIKVTVDTKVQSK